MARSKALRANNVLGKVFVPFILSLIIFGWRLATLEIGYGYLVLALGRRFIGWLYIVQFQLCFVYLLVCFWAVYFGSRRPVQRRSAMGTSVLPPAVARQKVVYACDEVGEPARCRLDGCAGSFLSTRTRHCRDCGECRWAIFLGLSCTRESDTRRRPGFDHHCPFVDSCIYGSTFKPFVLFILAATILIGLGVIPVLKPFYNSLLAVRKYTWDTDYMHRIWWSRWYSWLGGPIWRSVRPSAVAILDTRSNPKHADGLSESSLARAIIARCNPFRRRSYPLLVDSSRRLTAGPCSSSMLRVPCWQTQALLRSSS